MTHTKNHAPAHHHEHHDHAHEHEHLPLSKGWKYAVLAGNAVIGATELALGIGNSALSVLADGVHNVGDVATYREQIENVSNKNRSEKRRQMTRRLSHWIISATSAGVGVKAGYDLVTGQESHWTTPSMIVAGASLALSGTLYSRLRSQMKNTPTDSEHAKDLAKHFWGVDIPSAGLALAGAAVQRYSVPAEQVLGVLNGALGAYVFRPTEANLTHVCPTSSMNGLPHSGQSASLSQDGGRTGLLARMKERAAGFKDRLGWRRAAAMGAVAITAGAFLMGGLNDDEPATNSVPAAVQPDGEVLPEPVMECVTAQSGDSQWSLSERRVLEVTGSVPSETLTYHVGALTASLNDKTHPDPSVIYPGDCLKMPSATAIYSLQAGS